MDLARRLVWFLALYLMSNSSPAQSVSGYVFGDTNHNGIKDANEQGIKGVAVSDEVNVVVTDEKGYYQLREPAGFGLIFISVPDGYSADGGYWQKVAGES